MKIAAEHVGGARAAEPAIGQRMAWGAEMTTVILSPG
jgi:hypothetical protein